MNLLQTKILESTINENPDVKEFENQNQNQESNENLVEEIQENNIEITNENINDEIEINTQIILEDLDWYLEIPSIGLTATSIQEGTTVEIMEYYIGHFEETSKNIRKCRSYCT